MDTKGEEKFSSPLENNGSHKTYFSLFRLCDASLSEKDEETLFLCYRIFLAGRVIL